MKQQDIVWVKLPFSSLKQSKIRPAVIVSNNNYNKASEDVVVCAVTSKLEEKRYSIFINNSNLSSGKLPLKSKIKADKIMQIEKSLIIKTFASLNNKTFDLLTNKIMKLVQREK